ncbi:MAG TPA: lysoplasmalogenase [Polyangiaceae bacterium]|nr:lysoplasmalogenase [Polyangiaceae bacterium]
MALTSSIALTLAVVGFVVGLLVAEWRHEPRAAFVCKTFASVGFVALGFLHRGEEDGALGAYLVLGLVLAAGGDVALAVRGERSFLVGLGLFLLGHLAYVLAFASVVPRSGWTSPLGLVPVVFTAGAYFWLSRRLGSMRVPVILYMATITGMVVAALAVLEHGDRGAPLLFGGAVLFYASDLSVARDRFVAPGFANKAWGLPAYYAGQLLLAWALR